MNNTNCTQCKHFVSMDGKQNAKNGLCKFWQVPVDSAMECPRFKSKEDNNGK